MAGTSKVIIATELLEQGLRLYIEKYYFAALNLAGAAEEVFGAYVKARGATNSYERTVKSAVEFTNIYRTNGSKAKPKEMGKIINDAKNATKHKYVEGDNTVDFDPKSEAYEMIDRALDNYYNLMPAFNLQETELMKQFNKMRRESI